MGRLTGRDSSRRIFEKSVRWIDAVTRHEADAEGFFCWAMHSPAHLDEAMQALTIWRDLSALSVQQRAEIQELADTET